MPPTPEDRVVEALNNIRKELAGISTKLTDMNETIERNLGWTLTPPAARPLHNNLVCMLRDIAHAIRGM